MNCHSSLNAASDGEVRSDLARAAHCRLQLQLDSRLTGKLGRRLAGTPYVTFLLELYLAELEGKPTFQSCIAADEPPANTHRRAAELARLGALRRDADPLDHRRITLRLEPKIRKVLDEAMDRLAAAHNGQKARLSPSSFPSTERKNFREQFDSSASLEETVNTMPQGRIVAGGRLALPAIIRRSLGLQTGDTVMFELDHDQLRIRPAPKMLTMVQERLRMFAPTLGLASAELIAMRRSEAARGR